MFLPSAFFVILLVLLLARLPRGAFVVIASVLIVLGSIRTVTYAARWNDRLTLYETSLREQPHSIRLHMLLAHELMERGRLDEAAAVAARGREEMPDYPDIWIQSAVIAMQDGKLDDADAFLNKSLDIKPTFKALGWQEKLSKLRSATTAPNR
jgi:tetratricopeptide (TPR) repeat protein